MVDRREFHAICACSFLAFSSQSVRGANEASGTYSQFRLRDGRYLSYREFGSREGKPILYFHATPGAALDVLLLLNEVDCSAYRIIAVDRPGTGCSSPKPCHSIRGYAEDVAELAANLGIDQYHAVGYSGGCRFALACASAHNTQVLSTSLICVRAPGAPGVARGVVDDQIDQVVRYPRLARRVMETIARKQRNNATTVQGLQSGFDKLADVDRWAAKDYEALLLKIFRSATQQGAEGIIADIKLMNWPWGIELSQITNEVKLWSGTCDLTAPLSTLRFFESRLPRCSTHILEGEGHLSLILKRGAEILANL